MTNDITSTTSAPTLTLEECDEHATQGLLLLSKAVLNYAKHGLTSKEIGQRVRDLGAKVGDSTIRRWIAGFRADKQLPEKKVHRATTWRREQRVANAQNEQMQQPPQPAPLTTTDPTIGEELAPLAPATSEAGKAMEAFLEETDNMTDQELQIARLEWERDCDRAAVETVLKSFGTWDKQVGFTPDDPFTLIQKNLDELNLNQLEALQADITRRINRGTAIDV